MGMTFTGGPEREAAQTLAHLCSLEGLGWGQPELQEPPGGGFSTPSRPQDTSQGLLWLL